MADASSGIFLISDEGGLVRLEQTPYASELDLQQLLARYPELIPGDQIDSAAPRRWLLIDRETNIPKVEGGGGWWSLDHLFIDQDGVPTLVEVKRASDTRARREVVAQMLDYASNAVVYWPVETIQTSFEARCAREGIDAEACLADYLGPETDVEGWWQDVKTNLQAGRIRMIFVADAIAPELRRIVEFLNEQMDPAEVLAVEVRHFSGERVRSLVPRVIGVTEHATGKKRVGNKDTKQWEEESFFAALETASNKEVVAAARRLLAWGKANSTYVWWGRGKDEGGFIPVLTRGGEKHRMFEVWTRGTVEIFFQWLAYTTTFKDVEKRRDLLQRLRAIEGVELGDHVIDRRPTIDLATIADPKRLEKFIGVYDWVVDEIRRWEAAGGNGEENAV